MASAGGPGRALTAVAAVAVTAALAAMVVGPEPGLAPLRVVGWVSVAGLAVGLGLGWPGAVTAAAVGITIEYGLAGVLSGTVTFPAPAAALGLVAMIELSHAALEAGDRRPWWRPVLVGSVAAGAAFGVEALGRALPSAGALARITGAAAAVALVTAFVAVVERLREE